MSSKDLTQVIKRAIGDAAFRRQLQSDPKGALKGFTLSPQESAAVSSGDPTKLSALGVDQRMSKAFALSGAATGRYAADSDLAGGGRASTIPGDLDDARFDSGLVGDSTKPSGALISDQPGASSRGAISGDPSRGPRAADAEDQAGAGLRGARADDMQGGGRAVEDDMLSADAANRAADSGATSGGRAVIGTTSDNDMLSADEANRFASAREAEVAPATGPTTDRSEDFLAAEGHETIVGTAGDAVAGVQAPGGRDAGELINTADEANQFASRSAGNAGESGEFMLQAEQSNAAARAALAGSERAGDAFLTIDEAGLAESRGLDADTAGLATRDAAAGDDFLSADDVNRAANARDAESPADTSDTTEGYQITGDDKITEN